MKVDYNVMKIILVDMNNNLNDTKLIKRSHLRMKTFSFCFARFEYKIDGLANWEAQKSILIA